jgi:hypothetical protein
MQPTDPQNDIKGTGNCEVCATIRNDLAAGLTLSFPGIMLSASRLCS